jgi:hypothetical protein
VLRRVWQQYYEVVAGNAKWRAGPQASADEGVIRSPYDPQAQTGKKRETPNGRPGVACTPTSGS